MVSKLMSAVISESSLPEISSETVTFTEGPIRFISRSIPPCSASRKLPLLVVDGVVGIAAEIRQHAHHHRQLARPRRAAILDVVGDLHARRPHPAHAMLT